MSFVRLFESFDPVRVAAGELSTYYFVFRVGAAVPRFETWETTVAGDHPRMRAMITHARAHGYDETVALGTEDATLRSRGSGKKVISRKQTIAIGMSEARRSGEKVPPPPRRKKPT